MLIPLQAEAARKVKAESEKEKLVLMPMRVPEEDKNLTGAMETALVNGLQRKYDVYSGEQVTQKAHEIFMKESRNTTHNECDETKCMQNIAMAFQSEMIATANVTKQNGSYFLALSIQNIFDNKVVYSESVPCKNCDPTEVVQKLKELSGTVAPVVSYQTVEEPQNRVNFADAETALWEEVKKGNAEEDYQAYLSQYPKGKYIALAMTKLRRLKDETNQKREQDIAVTKQANIRIASLNQANTPSMISRELLSGLVIDFYNQHSEWTGVFTISSIVRSKIVDFDMTKKQAHVEYQFVAVPGNKLGRNDSGVDKRTFDLVWSNGKWQVTKMGEHLSGNL